MRANKKKQQSARTEEALRRREQGFRRVLFEDQRPARTFGQSEMRILMPSYIQ